MKQHGENCISGFTIWEKLYAQITFHGGILVGAYGLFLESTSLGIGYLIYAYIGILSLMRYTVCPRCPHILVANDCVQLHPTLTKRIISLKRFGPLNSYEKVLFVMVLYGILLLPIYWLAANPIVLALFLLLYGGQLLGLLLHFSRHCENKVCIQNRNTF